MAATTHERTLSGEKARRIVEAMRASVGERGAAGSTFDHVAREAGVSRGLLHYYFGTKERLLVEVVRRDCDLRMATLDEALAGAATADAFLDVLVRSLEDFVARDAASVTLIHELFVLSRHTPDIGAEMAELFRRTQAHLGALLERAERDGVLRLGDDPGAVAAILFSLADGLAMRMVAEPGGDFGAVLRAGITATRALLAEPR
ncbi:MAG TPA: TetR/AcrR family transcriptional regulator [Solirubrobacteraceae bacterium]|nr:TetR/AcrR family transcriptional regulator [Solirubrobacteraceae bacterium]